MRSSKLRGQRESAVLAPRPWGKNSRTVTKCRVLTRAGLHGREYAQDFEMQLKVIDEIYVSTQKQFQGSDGCMTKRYFQKKADSSSILVQH